MLTHETRLAPDAVERMLSRLVEDDQIGVVGPLLGYTSRPNQVWSAGGVIDRRSWETNHVQDPPRISDWAGRPPHPVVWLEGACLWYRAEGELSWTVVQTCTVHLIRQSLRYVPRRDYNGRQRPLVGLYRDRRRSCPAALDVFAQKWGEQLHPIIAAWRDTWEHVIPFVAFPPEVRRGSTRRMKMSSAGVIESGGLWSMMGRAGCSEGREIGCPAAGG